MQISLCMRVSNLRWSWCMNQRHLTGFRWLIHAAACVLETCRNRRPGPMVDACLRFLHIDPIHSLSHSECTLISFMSIPLKEVSTMTMSCSCTVVVPGLHTHIHELTILLIAFRMVTCIKPRLTGWLIHVFVAFWITHELLLLTHLRLQVLLLLNLLDLLQVHIMYLLQRIDVVLVVVDDGLSFLRVVQGAVSHLVLDTGCYWSLIQVMGQQVAQVWGFPLSVRCVGEFLALDCL